MAFELNYDELINLDAADLAEAGIKHAYEELVPVLSKYVDSPAELRGDIDNDAPRYSALISTRNAPSPGLQLFIEISSAFSLIKSSCTRRTPVLSFWQGPRCS